MSNDAEIKGDEEWKRALGSIIRSLMTVKRTFLIYLFQDWRWKGKERSQVAGQVKGGEKVKTPNSLTNWKSKVKMETWEF